ncbi:MAG: ABC transporter permease [Alphaproteobacteria bacterium]|nr:ABC transporter permease [Alphaproteobacteria bacterium]
MTEPAVVELAPTGPLGRIYALALRHLYLLRGSWPRLLELVYWPTVQMILWGMITQFLVTESTWVQQAGGALIAGVLLWDVLFRGSLGFTITFLEEMWSRNLGHLFVSPLRPVEMVVAFMLMSLVRTLIGTGGAAVIAIILYHYSVFDMGLALVAFFAALLVMSWSFGMFVSALILRFGLGAESLAWFLVFALAPVSCVYYPVSVLPDWVEPIAFAFPSSHIFEGMRAVLIDHEFRFDLWRNAMLLDIAYLAGGAAAFLFSVRVARQRGLLHQVGE